MSTLTSFCKACGHSYTIGPSEESHLNPPTDYRKGCHEYCLGCWLGVGPADIPEAYPPSLQSLVHDLTIPCADNGREFTRTERITRIAGLLAESTYTLLASRPLARIWKHRDFDPARPMVLVSSHLDSLYTRYHCTLEDGVFLGTFDNSITNAAIIDRMLGGRLPPQVLVAFTGDEERGSRGADQVMEALASCDPAPHPEMVVVLDVTEEAYDRHAASFENLFCQSRDAVPSRLNFASPSDLADFIRDLPEPGDPFLIEQGAADESWRYDAHNLCVCALCLPIQTLTGNMHADVGVYAKAQTVADYTETISRFVTALLTRAGSGI